MPKQKDTHPWKLRQSVQLAERKAKQEEPSKPRPPITTPGWACPNCGMPDCNFGECADGDF